MYLMNTKKNLTDLMNRWGTMAPVIVFAILLGCVPAKKADSAPPNTEEETRAVVLAPEPESEVIPESPTIEPETPTNDNIGPISMNGPASETTEIAQADTNESRDSFDPVTGSRRIQRRPGREVESDLSGADLLTLPGQEKEPADSGAAPQQLSAVERPLEVTKDGENIPSGRLLLIEPGETLDFSMALGQVEADRRSPAFRASSESGGRHVIESSRRVELDTTGGTMQAFTPDNFSWKAPDNPGLQMINVEIRQSYLVEGQATEKDSSDSTILLGQKQIPVMVQYPFKRDETLIERYPLGMYPDETAPSVPGAVSRDPSRYAPPKWFVKIDSNTRDYKVSEHFKLGDFASPSERDEPHFVSIDPKLITFLELVTDTVQQRYGPEAQVKILRSYLSPLERQRLDQRGASYTQFTRYQYGDAAALIVDIDGDGKLDDLNNDNRVDREDANALADLLDEVKRNADMRGASGVVDGPTEPNWPDTPYAVVDLRGFNTRW
ncbi:MAG: hypothetical protein ACLFUS_07745 [Candidatus Sumerlaeia bacterium]